MERIKELNRYQKIILILLAVLLVVFTALYAVTFSRVGFEYGGQILVPHEENGMIRYCGTIRGTETVISVTADQTVTLHYGDRRYGPYTAREDPTAIPDGSQMAPYMTGVEIRDADAVFFRGGVFSTGDGLIAMDEDGSVGGFTIVYSDGVERDQNGHPVDRMKPSASTILELMDGPELTRKGEWAAWLCGVFLSAVTAVSILYADELFRWHISFRVQNPEDAEPSEMEIAGRYISWTVLPVLALIVYIVGLL